MALWLIYPRERLLMQIAHPVVALDRTRDQSGQPKEETYWLTNQRLLIITRDAPGIPSGSSWRGHADLFDTTTRKRQHLVGLTAVLNARSASGWDRPYDFQLSPSGSRVSWWSRRNNAGIARDGSVIAYDGTASATLEGAGLCEWNDERPPRMNQTFAFWKTDQDLVVAGCQTFARGQNYLSELRMVNVCHARSSRSIGPGSAEAFTILAPYSQRHPFESHAGLDLYGFGVNKRWFDPTSGHIVESWDWVALPKDARLVAGPSDNRHHSTVPVFLQRHEIPPITMWLHRVFPWVRVKPVDTEGLWLVRYGAPEVQEVAQFAGPVDAHNVIVADNYVLEMLPDGTEVSFIYHSTLYVVRIDRD